MSNGQITNRVVPFGESTLTPEEINLCTESRNPSVFVFSTPVHLQAGKEYAFVVKPHGDDPLPRISVAELGGTDLLTSRIISKIPASGMLFASQNDRTYRPIQNEDIKYTMFRAAFTTVDKGVAYFENEPDDFFTIDNISGTFRAGEKLRGASNVAIVELGRGDLGTSSFSGAVNQMPIGARVRGLTTGAIGLVRAKSTVAGNTVKVIVDSANTFLPNETLKITYGGDAGFGNTVFGKVSQATGSAANTTQANTSTGFVQFFDPVFNRLTVNSSTGTFSAATNTGTSFVRGQQSNAVARITAVRNIKLNAVVPKFASIAYGNSNLFFAQKLSSNAYVLPTGAGSFTPVTPGVTNILNQESIIASRTNEIDNMSSAKSYTTRAVMTTDNDRVSPVIGIKKAASILGVQNIINNPSNFETKEVIPGGPVQARYISKPIVLADGQDAEDLKVYTTAFKPQGAEVTVYARLLSASDNDKIEEKHFTKLTQVTSANTLSTSANDFREYEFKLPSSNATQASAFLNSLNNDVVRYASNTDNSLHDTFKQYQIKIVITSDDSAKIARVTDLRTIALQV